MRVLIVRIGSMGDVLHAMPAVAALRAAHPEWFIGWAIEPRWNELLQIAGDPDDLGQIEGRHDPRAMVDRWYRVATGEWRRRPLARRTWADMGALKRVMQHERFDVCVDMQGSLKSAVVGRMAGATVFAGMAEPRERAARLLYGLKVPVRGEHMVEQGCEVLGAAVGEVLQPARVRLPIDERDERWADEAVGQERFCLVGAGGGWGAKIWPAERFGAVAAELGRAGLRTVVSAVPGGDGLAAQVVAGSEGYARAVECGVGELVALTRRAAVVVAGDTGPLHLGAALERPVVGIYGPTSPLRNGPWGTRSRVLRDAGSVTSHKRVSEAEEGMLRIGVGEVVEAVGEVATW